MTRPTIERWEVDLGIWRLPTPPDGMPLPFDIDAVAALALSEQGNTSYDVLAMVHARLLHGGNAERYERYVRRFMRDPVVIEAESA